MFSLFGRKEIPNDALKFICDPRVMPMIRHWKKMSNLKCKAEDLEIFHQITDAIIKIFTKGNLAKSHLDNFFQSKRLRVLPICVKNMLDICVLNYFKDEFLFEDGFGEDLSLFQMCVQYLFVLFLKKGVEFPEGASSEMKKERQENYFKLRKEVLIHQIFDCFLTIVLEDMGFRFSVKYLDIRLLQILESER